MKVNQSPESKFGLPASVPSRTAEGAGAPAKGVGGSSASPSGTSVTFSPVTQVMTNGVARSGTDSFDAAKVEAMRTAIQNGSFSVNAEAIADKLLGSARELLGIAGGARRQG
ncbi:flagellar biosynthesis anti-sigma factor FlgM [Tepidimonas thermarum]|uniref:Negative regulator of flagellin synthesis n=1 Tax=Tepidimonas thermarum TaxID=335431 RepID=A0A554X6S5_9BURK|nr:flagellar biosynthesis anti-sigma factor FlgM [Tepidimonas thermarum]TSE31466.1 flagellar biosynthesis anti-sigma factor FlgM [Tepidimonas thermarum]